ncbi:MAG TPA: SDR family oxidoreductase [Firmicutes bacterium]|nr:SDR family oxidoreductase [Bacillota bacterium]
MDLLGEVAFVTGGAGDVCEGVARALWRLGAAVAICDVSGRGEAITSSIREGGGRALFVECDVSREEDVAHVAQRVRETLGPVSLLVNSLAISPGEPFLETSVALWDSMIAVNLRRAFLTCKGFLPGMLAMGRGTIINMVSTEARPRMSAFIASTQGIVGLTRSIAAELQHEKAGVHIVALDTGSIPPRLVGAAAAYLAVALASEYHGKVVDGSTVLDKAAQARPLFLIELVPERTLRRAVDLGRRFQEVIQFTEADFNRLPIFLRPIAKAQFKAATGMSISAWARLAADLLARLQKIEASDQLALNQFRSEYPELKRLISRLVEYCRRVPEEAARFTKDPDALREVSRVALEREEILKAFIAVLDKIYAS